MVMVIVLMMVTVLLMMKELMVLMMIVLMVLVRMIIVMIVTVLMMMMMGIAPHRPARRDAAPPGPRVGSRVWRAFAPHQRRRRPLESGTSRHGVVGRGGTTRRSILARHGYHCVVVVVVVVVVFAVWGGTRTSPARIRLGPVLASFFDDGTSSPTVHFSCRRT